MSEKLGPFDLNTVVQGDCLELMKHIPDNSVDCVITDPPYGVGIKYTKFEDTKENLSNLIKRFMPELLRISKGPVLITSGVGNMWLYPQPKWVLNWCVNAGSGSGPWGFCSWQPILAYGPDPYLKNRLGRRPDTFITAGISDKNNHPCPKPELVMRWIIKRGLPFENEIAFDPVSGS